MLVQKQRFCRLRYFRAYYYTYLGKRRVAFQSLTIVLLCMVLAAFVTGCWGRRELENIAFLSLMGLDAVISSDGKPLSVKEAGLDVTMAISIPRMLGGGEGGAMQAGGNAGTGAPVLVIQTSSSNITMAAESVKESIDRDFSGIHLEAIIVGEDLAKQGLDDVLDLVLRHRNLRHTIPIAVIKGRAADFIHGVFSTMESNPWTYVRQLILSIADGRVSRQVHIHDLLISRESKSKDAVLPLLRPWTEASPGEKDKASQRLSAAIVGGAIFKDATMVGELDVWEASHLLMIRGGFKRVFMSYLVATEAPESVDQPAMFQEVSKGDNRVFIGIEWEGAKTHKKVETRRNNGVQSEPHIKVSVELEGTILELPGDIDLTSAERMKALEWQVEQELRNIFESVINKAQIQFEGADIFNFGDSIRRSFRNWSDWESFEWPKRFQEATIQVETEVHLRRPGLSLRNMWKLD